MRILDGPGWVFHGDGASDAIDGWGDLWAPGWYGCGWGWGLGGYGGWGWYGYWGSYYGAGTGVAQTTVLELPRVPHGTTATPDPL